MDLFSIIAISLAVSFCSRVLAKRRVLLQHPATLEHYLSTKSGTCSAAGRKLFATYGATYVMNLCLEIIQVDTYVFASGEASLEEVGDTFVEDHVLDFFRLTATGKEVNPQTQAGFGALQCAKKLNVGLYIENWCDKNGFHVFQMEENSENFYIAFTQFAALLVWSLRIVDAQMRASTSSRAYVNQMLHDSEQEFRINQNSVGEHSRKNICELDEFRKFQICSAAHGVWYKIRRSGLPVVHEVKSPDEGCLSNAAVELSTLSSTVFDGRRTHLAINLLPCVVNASPKYPNFYVAADQRIDDGAFLLQKHPNGQYFKLAMRINGVTALKNNILR